MYNSKDPYRRETSYGGRDEHSGPSVRKSISTLSDQTKATVLSIKKIQSPFDSEHQGAFKQFVKHVEITSKGESENIDLSEVGLLLAGATRIFTSQVDSLTEDVQNLLAFVTKSKKVAIEKKKTKKTDDGENKDKNELNEGDASTTTKEDGLDTSVVIKEEPITVDADGTSSGNNPETLVNSEIGAITDGSLTESVPDVLNVPEINGSDDANSVDAIISEIPGPNTRKRSQLLNSILELDENGQPVKKKNRFVLAPPKLISCVEELEILIKAGLMNLDDENCNISPPTLDLACRLSRKRHMMYTEDSIPVKKLKDDFVVKPKDPPKKDISDIDDNGSQEGNPSTLESSTDDTKANCSESFNPLSFPSTASATNFSPEDQAAIQECINELHYLPFTFELSKSDLATAFSKTVERMSSIFRKNNVQVTRNIVKEVSVIAKVATSSSNKPGDSSSTTNSTTVDPPPTAHTLGEIYNTFVKSCRQECESYITSEKIILERNKEKSFAESRANIRAMIAELQKNIVPKFALVPLMAENTPEFFQHVTNFEKKMKKILEEEAKKDEFDVRKYERDVLEVTAKESSEMDRMSEADFFVAPFSPLKPPNFEVDLSETIHASPSTRSSFDGSQSSCGSSWVPIKHIFQHMKSIDRTEAARSFYAVLALLSYQNLDINYEQLYSVESAQIYRQTLTNLNKEEEIDSKFPRGVKIVTSRCPDVDKEEVFIAALTSESRDEAFRHLLNQDGNSGLEGGGPGSSSMSSMNGHVDDGIRELMADFVEESSTIFSGRLEGRKRKKKENS